MEHFRGKSAILGVAAYGIEHFLERSIFTRCQFSKPKAQERLNLPLLLRSCGVVCRLRVQRNCNCGVRHDASFTSFYGKSSAVAFNNGAWEWASAPPVR